MVVRDYFPQERITFERKRGALSSMCTPVGNNESTNKLWWNQVKASCCVDGRPCSVQVVFLTDTTGLNESQQLFSEEETNPRFLKRREI